MTRLARIAVVLAAVALTSGLHLPADAAVGDLATGNYTRPEPSSPGTCIRGAFFASTSASGTTGYFYEAEYSCATGRFTGAYVRGNVTCMAIVYGGTMTYASGLVTDAVGTFAGSPAFLIVAKDNSTPSSPANPDTMSSQRVAAPTCGVTAAQGGITQGDIRVRPGTPGT